MRIPHSLVTPLETGLTSACKVSLVCPGTGSWRGWVVGSGASQSQHLVIVASPRPLRNDVKLVDGPSWHPGARVKPLAWLEISGRRVRAVLAPASSDSAFGHHVVLIWTVGRHTYGVGFHDFAGLHQTLLLDEELARHIKLVGP